jgi:protoheme IX farnesyltransferase
MADNHQKKEDRLAGVISEYAAPLLKGLMGHGGISLKKEYSLFERMFSFFEITRPFLLTMAPPITGAGAILANGEMPHLGLVLLGSLAAVLATAGIHTYNDWWDRRRDFEAWPDRPIPTLRISPAAAMAFASFLMAASIVIVWFSFNAVATVVLAVGIALGILYTILLRDAVGYLSLPLIIAVFPLGGWAAFSPETLLSSPVPWFLAGTAIVWQCGHIMVHSSSHPIRTESGRLLTEKKAFFFYPSPLFAARMGLCFTVLTFLASVGLMFMVQVGWLYAVIALPMGLVAILWAVSLVKEPTSKERSMGAFNVASLYLIFVFGGVVIDVFLRKSLRAYLIGTSHLLATLADFIYHRLEGAVTLFYALGGIVSVAVVLFVVVSLSRLLLKAVRQGTRT